MAEQQLKVARRERKRVYIVSTDLDYLKMINDNLGHKTGDLALIETANILKTTFRQSDIIARIGGDEFVILTIENNIEALIARLKAIIDARNAKEGQLYELSLSFGYSFHDAQDPCSIEELLSRADKLMYEEKNSKKN